MNIHYGVNQAITTEQFIDLLVASTLGERRPIDDPICMEGMVKNSNLIVTAWDESRLVGVARSLTDFHYACYVSDLAVHRDYQRHGIGQKLLSLTQEQLGSHATLILIAAPAADAYYPRIGFSRHPRCWVRPSP
ncbi:MAG: GNAT family N-acetyltransferase [Cyanobacteriota bacterium]|nr:GNAT family N-acetyltransferase [Cyanobacteriota bacterium]